VDTLKGALDLFKTQPLSTRLSLAGLLLIVLAVFTPSLQSDLVYDSATEIVQWNFIHEPGQILTPLTFQLMGLDVLDFNRPVAVTFLMFESMLWGKNPVGYHLTNIILHGLIVCLVFLLIRRFLSFGSGPCYSTRRDVIAFLVTLIFAIHPLVTEPVCEPSYCKDLLAALFGLTALMLAIRHDPGAKKGDVLRMFLCPLLCLLAIGSKEVGVAFPAILFLYWLIFRRTEPGRFWAWTLAGSFGVVIVFLIARFALAHNPSVIFVDPPHYPGDSLSAALVVEPRILAVYLINIFWPAYLCADYNGYSVKFLPLPFAMLILVPVILGLGWWSMKDRRILFGAGFIALCLLPTSNLVPIYHPMADRYLYLPLIGIVLLAGLALDRVWMIAKLSHMVAVSLLVLLLCAALITITLQREKVWSTGLALWRDTLERNPASLAGRTDYPEALLLAGRLTEARYQSEMTLRTPYVNIPLVWLDYALELNRLGDRAGAEQAARRALALKPDLVDTAKMIQTLQYRADIATEFAQLAASLPRQAP